MENQNPGGALGPTFKDTFKRQAQTCHDKMVHALVQSISALEKTVADAVAAHADSSLPSGGGSGDGTAMNNGRRKQLYSQLELLLLDHELDSSVCDGEGGVLDTALAQRITAIRQSLKLQPIQRPRRWWAALDTMYRFCGVCCGFFAISIVLSLPILALQVVGRYTRMHIYIRK